MANANSTGRRPKNATDQTSDGQPADSLVSANGQFNSDAQYHGFLEESPDAIIVVDQTGHINFATNRLEAVLGYRADEVVGEPISLLIPERYRDLHAGHLHRFMIAPAPRMMGSGMELLARRKDGSELPVEISLSPHRGAGSLVAVAAIRDIDADRRLQQLLLKELHHRLKNMLAMVIAITSQSLRAAKDIEEGRTAVESRLMSLGRAHDLLLQSKTAGARLSDVIHDATAPFDSRDVRRIVVQDTDIEIASEAILPLTMSLNELCTNAVKYGALSNATGRIDITSTVDDTSRWLKLTWTESGGPAVREPATHGFGTRLINRLADQLQGHVRLRYEPKGVVCEFEIPLPAPRVARPE